MDTVKIFFSNQEHVYNKGTTYYDISKDCKNISNIVAYKIGNEIFSLDNKALEDTKIEFINYEDIVGSKIYKAGLKFLFEVSLKKAFPNMKISYEHSVPCGMLGMVYGDKILSRDDISTIKSIMADIVMQDIKIEKFNVDPIDAIKYYKEIDEPEKALNIQNINDKVVTLYKLFDHLNYFYSLMPYSTGVINKYEMVYLGNNKIIFLFPSNITKGVVPEYVHYDKILKSFYEGKQWLNKHNIPYITDLNKTIGNGKIKQIIKSSEIRFNLELVNATKKIIDNDDIKFVMIAGPSSSGKTTTTSRISSYLASYGYDPIKISIDDYFKEREDSPKDENGDYDYEGLDAVDLELFNNDLKNLLNNKEIDVPRYNFITGKKEYNNHKIKLKSNSIILIEGLHSLNDELMPQIDNKYKFKIYLSPFIPINIDRHNYISTLDLRLIRRIIRDNRKRGYNVSTTIDNWQKVRKGEEKHIFPYIHQADIIINTALAYEVGVLKVFAEPLLYSIGIDNNYYEEARRLLDFLKQFYPIPGEYINDESILREFIGGRYYD